MRMDPRVKPEDDGGEEKPGTPLNGTACGTAALVRPPSLLSSSSGLTRGSIRTARPLLPKKHAPFSPPTNSVPTILPSRHGYAARRGSEVGPALVAGEGREPAPQGPAENGLPPATRGKRRGVGPTLPFHAPDGAPGVPVRHTRGPGPADASASSAGVKPLREGCESAFPSAIAMARDCACQNGGAHPGNRRQASTAPALAEGPQSRAKTAERGAERCRRYNFSDEAASSAPSDAL
ncbi:hypothetical protein EV665_10441 [Shinella granuli]|uniref:Uncharacterized protein n=1 Tax=Shinella granuli TaxID=323621 RepID=A0A4R2D4W3_SHIGR|nr:hypothetical protein EV665_10441 [Shinella granuli]